MGKLSGKKVAILATDGFEQSELVEPRRALTEAGATCHVIAPEPGRIQGWRNDEWGDAIKVDRALANVRADEYDLLLLPGGVKNPDTLRMNPLAVAFVEAFVKSARPIAAICHGPQLLIEAGVRGRTMTSYASLKTDLKNAGATWVDQAVVVDRNLVTSRTPDDLPAFNEAVIDELARAPDRRPARSTEGAPISVR